LCQPEAENECAGPGVALIHRFLVLAQVAFWAGLDAENECLELGNHLKNCFLDLAQVSFWATKKAETEFAGPGNSLKHRFLNLALERPEGRKWVRWDGNPLKHPFLNITNVAFCVGQKVENGCANPHDPLKQIFIDHAQVPF
jgi:hypothetical protein